MSSLEFQIAGGPLRAGDDWDQTIPLETESGEPFVWPAGVSIRMHLRDKVNSVVPDLSLSSADGQLEPLLGGLRFMANRSLTSNVSPGLLPFDVEVTVGGKRDTFIAGVIEVVQKVTRDF